LITLFAIISVVPKAAGIATFITAMLTGKAIRATMFSLV
jgi:hypothetical protein